MWQVLQARFGGMNWEIAKHRNRSAEAPSWLHPWQDAAGSPPALLALARFSPWVPKHPKGSNSASLRSQSAHIPQLRRPRHTNSCAVDLRNVLAATSQQFAIPLFVAYKIQSLQTGRRHHSNPSMTFCWIASPEPWLPSRSRDRDVMADFPSLYQESVAGPHSICGSACALRKDHDYSRV